MALSYEKLGQLLDQNGDRLAAKPYLLKAHTVLDEARPPDQHALYRSARRLAFLCDNLGESDEAIRYYEKAIAAGTQLEDVPHSELGTMLNNVALIFRKSGRQKAAEPYYLHALQIYEKQLGPEHADVASVLNNLGVFYTNERRFTEAEKTHLRALAIREKVHPPTHPDIAQSKCNLAVVYHSRGDYTRAAGTVPGLAADLGGIHRDATGGLRNRRVELCGSSSLVRQGAQGRTPSKLKRRNAAASDSHATGEVELPRSPAGRFISLHQEWQMCPPPRRTRHGGSQAPAREPSRHRRFCHRVPFERLSRRRRLPTRL